MIFLLFSFSHKIIKKRYELKDQDFTVFIGDSHIRSSLNDNLVKNHVNLSLDAETFYFSYFKLKLLLRENSHVKRVYLGFGYHSLSSFYDDFITGNNSKIISSNYFFILPVKEQIKYMFWNRMELPSYMRTNFKNKYNNLKGKWVYSFNEGYFNQSKDTASIKYMNRRLQAQFYLKGKAKAFSSINIEYLKKIKHLCKSNDIELVLFNTPLHSFYKNNIPAEYLIKFEGLIKEYDFKIIDLSNLVMDDDCFRKDGDHVTVKGAVIITQQFINYLNDSHYNYLDL